MYGKNTATAVYVITFAFVKVRSNLRLTAEFSIVFSLFPCVSDCGSCNPKLVNPQVYPSGRFYCILNRRIT